MVGGASDCNDFGFNFNSGTFRGYNKLSTECTRDLATGDTLVKPGTWYMVAITSNATHNMIYVNGEFKDINTVCFTLCFFACVFVYFDLHKNYFFITYLCAQLYFWCQKSR